MNDSLIPILLLIFFVLAIFFLGSAAGYEWGYKRGQIDVMTGTVQYCLEKQEDLTLVWIYKEEGCER